ncbi:MAG: ribosome biogenesis GTP-binding protein YihA/YsxC [Bacteroidales bacterium]|jgi:GTP-binding protein|nr:ribosome biogenesis GTP-binding protein YihA/YsxC [Bacteroidales bacterium]
MIIRSALFITSSPTLKQCPAPDKPEFGFIGRSNVGKSSLINMLTGFSKLAKTSGQPGKTRSINHFLINDNWYLVDLPGYGYAKVPEKIRREWTLSSGEYILKRDNLLNLFVLIDSRLNPQKSDISFMRFLGNSQIPFCRVFTKTDKISGAELEKTVRLSDQAMLEDWESLPPTFFSSAVRAEGREEILAYIEESMNNFSNTV